MATANNQENGNTKNVTDYVIILIVIFIIAGLLLQWRSNSGYNDSIRIIGAKQECRAQAEQDGVSEAQAGCNLLGTSGYDKMTDYYYNEYKSRTGSHEL